MSWAWATVPLGDVVRLSDRAVPSSELAQVNLAGVYSFGRGLFKRGPLRPAETSYKSYNRLVPDDFVISQPKAWEGALARVTCDFDGWFLSPVFPTFTTKPNCLLPAYLEWFCKRKSVWQDLQTLSKGMGARRETVSPEQFLSLGIPLPPLDEQRRIVARIEDLTAKIDEAHRLLDESRKEVSAFVASMHDALASSQAEPLSSFLGLDEDAVPVEMGVPYPQVGVRGFGGGLFAKPPVFGGQTTYRVFNRLYSGALVMSQVKGWEGAVAMTPQELEGYFVSPEYRTFRCKGDRCSPEYLAALVPTEFFWSLLKDATRGVGARRERTRPEQFLQIRFSMPSLSDQRRAIGTFAIINKVQALQREIAPELDAMLPAILDKAFKGEL